MESLVDDVVVYPDVIAARLNRMFPWSFISFENTTLFIKHIIKQSDTLLQLLLKHYRKFWALYLLQIKWYIFSNNSKSSIT